MIAHVTVLAKAPVPGRVKTRLTPPLSPDEAAALAEAALSDTLRAVGACSAARRVLALDGPAGPWLPAGFEVVPQCAGDLGARLDHAWRAAGAPGLQIGMDTPQVTPGLLDEALARLAAPDVDAVLGLATDGGWWAIGFAAPVPAAFAGVPVSTPRTGRAQLDRLVDLGLRVGLLPELRDVDTIDDVAAVAGLAPASRFAAAAASHGVAPSAVGEPA